MTTGELLRLLRKAKKRTLRDVSSSCGMSLTHLCDIERDRGDISVGLLKRVCEAQGVALSEFFWCLEESR